LGSRLNPRQEDHHLWLPATDVLFTKYYYGDQIKEDDLGRACNTRRKEEEYIQNFSREFGGKRPLRRTTSKWKDNIKEESVRMLAGF